ncbi:hypothetical protein JL722_15219 [Aureococcus anophagefferens]|nr:hypothetical protein JL722_15219 [Aureococcus anophagefferens]
MAQHNDEIYEFQQHHLYGNSEPNEYWPVVTTVACPNGRWRVRYEDGSHGVVDPNRLWPAPYKKRKAGEPLIPAHNVYNYCAVIDNPELYSKSGLEKKAHELPRLRGDAAKLAAPWRLDEDPAWVAGAPNGATRRSAHGGPPALLRKANLDKGTTISRDIVDDLLDYNTCFYAPSELAKPDVLDRTYAESDISSASRLGQEAPPAPRRLWTMAALGAYKVKGKKGTICRAGVETDTAERSYFDSMGALSPPANPSGFKKPLIGPRCGDALPPADSLPPSTPARYRAAAVVCGAGAPACFVDGLIADDDPVYASVWKDRGLPAAVKCVFDPWSGAMLPVASSFVNGAGKAAARGVDLRLFYDDGAEAVQGCLRFGPGAQGGRDASLIDETYRVEAVCRLPEKGDEDDDDDDDLGKAVLFSDTGMKQRPVAATIFERC